MSETSGVILMMNNYFHDVATALLLASAIVMWVIYKKLGDSGKPDEMNYFLRLYDSITWLQILTCMDNTGRYSEDVLLHRV